jgi:transposase
LVIGESAISAKVLQGYMMWRGPPGLAAMTTTISPRAQQGTQGQAKASDSLEHPPGFRRNRHFQKYGPALLHLFGVQPHRSKSFKLSTDPFFVEKVRDIVGLYLNPPEKALVLCVDEKSQIQAIERSQPTIPAGLGEVEGIAHDYFRHGTTTLFAALDVASGEVIGQCKARHRHQEFLSFLRHVDKSVPASLDVHLVINNYATHKHPKVRVWLAQHPRYHVHYTPTYSSWLNQVERWFGLLTQRALKRNSFKTVTELTRKIDSFVEQYNAHSRPFVWTATADSILQKIERLCKVICGTPH